MKFGKDQDTAINPAVNSARTYAEYVFLLTTGNSAFNSAETYIPVNVDPSRASSTLNVNPKREVITSETSEVVETTALAHDINKILQGDMRISARNSNGTYQKKQSVYPEMEMPLVGISFLNEVSRNNYYPARSRKYETPPDHILEQVDAIMCANTQYKPTASTAYKNFYSQDHPIPNFAEEPSNHYTYSYSNNCYYYSGETNDDRKIQTKSRKRGSEFLDKPSAKNKKKLTKTDPCKKDSPQSKWMRSSQGSCRELRTVAPIDYKILSDSEDSSTTSKSSSLEDISETNFFTEL